MATAESHETINVPRDVWYIVLEYLEMKELKEDLTKRQHKIQYDKIVMDESLNVTNKRLKKSVQKLTHIKHKIEKCISFLEYTGGFQHLVSDLDKYCIELREEIQSIFIVLQNVQTTSHQLLSPTLIL